MKISVITPAYKAQDFLVKYIDSINKQTVQPDEILIGVDSCKETLKVCADLMEQNNKIKIFYFPEHAGCYRIRNILTILSTSDTLVLFDADDVMYPNYIKSVTDLVDDGVFCRPNFFNVVVGGTRKLSTQPAEGCIAIKREDVIDNAGWEPWNCAADSEFRFRAGRRDMVWCQTKEPVFDRCVHGGNLTSLSETNMKSAYRIKCRKEIDERKKSGFTRDSMAISRYIKMKDKSTILKYLKDNSNEVVVFNNTKTIVNFGDSEILLTGEILTKTKINQRFVAQQNQLKQIRLMCGTYTRKNTGTIKVSVLKGNLSIYSGIINIKDCIDNQFIDVDCKLKLDNNSVYSLNIDGINTSQRSTITLKYGKLSNKLKLISNGIELNGELNCQFIYGESVIDDDVEEPLSDNLGKVSIIIPTYNTSKYLKNLLNSIKSQRYNNYEVIVVDDGSEVNELKEIRRIIQEHKVDVKLLWSKDNKGAPYARNKGYDKSTGEYLLFCDSDIIMNPEMLEKMINKIHENTSSDWIYCDYQLSDKVLSFWDFNAKKFHKANCSSSMSLIRSSKFPRWDESIKKLQDWDLFLTMYDAGSVGTWINEVLFLAADRPNGITNSTVVSDNEAKSIVLNKHKKM